MNSRCLPPCNGGEADGAIAATGREAATRTALPNRPPSHDAAVAVPSLSLWERS